MKVLKAVPITLIFVEAEDGDYQRSGPEDWEKRYGESWEPLYRCEEIEAAYQEFLHADPSSPGGPQ
jgi:hypothetical protein